MSNGKCTQVNIDKLIIDGRYQRPVEEKRVARIVDNFDPKLVGTLELSLRGDGSFAVIDGQHRLAALKAVGRKRVPALVHDGLSSQQEASLFARLNITRKPLNPGQRFSAQVYAGDPQAVEISNVVTECGFRTCAGGKQIGDIHAIAMLERVYRNFGVEILRASLEMSRDLWPGEKLAVNGHFFGGLAVFLSTYGHRYNEEHAERIKRDSAQSFLRRAQERAIGGSPSMTTKLVADEIRKRAGLYVNSGTRHAVPVSKKTSDELATA